MHELSIAQALVDQLEKACDAQKATAVVRVTVEVGTLSGVDPDALGVAFPLAAEGTRAGAARLDVRVIPARVKCRACNAESQPEFPFCICTACSSSDVTVVSGRELFIREAELDVPEE